MEFIESERGVAVDVVIMLPHGLHSRPSARVAQAAREFDADIQMISEDSEVDAKSMLDILSLALKHNDHVRLLAKGPQAREALTAICGMLAGNGD